MHASQIFYALLVEPGISQRELCERTGYDKSTVSLIVNRLQELAIIERSQARKSGQRGRPMESLRISEEGGLLVGVHMEYDCIRFVSSSLGGAVGHSKDMALPTSPQTTGEVIRQGLSIFCNEIGRNVAEVQSIGVSIPGQLDTEGRLVYSPNLNWRDIDIGAQLHDRIDFPLFLGNDTKAAALAEHYFGVARGIDDFLMVSGGVGFGGALFLDGELYAGSGGFAGEVGHTKVVRNGRLCGCGAEGCVAAYLTLPALLERARAIKPGVTTLDEIEALAKQGDDHILDLLQESGELVGLAVSNAVNTLNPPVVILAGTLVKLWPFLGRGFQKALRANTLSAPLAQTEIRLSTLGRDPLPRGGVALALQGLISLAGPTGLPSTQGG
ncbi:ROK family protein [Agrobacterium tumefaciens]|uniref:ROK family protein n=1 Tax=Agrobacterium tumefaciens TaxID=358 RepID=UPI000555722D|nr:ROK family transcriptional regulator [Agrobacterium tumefaciens]